MKSVLVFVLLSGLFSDVVIGQRSGRRTPSPPSPGSVDAAERAYRQLRDLEIKQTTDAQNALLLEPYRKPSKDELEILKPTSSLVAKYAEFLRNENSGIVKLSAFEKCSKNGEVVSADEDCVKYKIPGGGTSFSFRYGAYRIQRLADLILQNAVLKSDGLLQQGIMVDLGKKPIESVDLSTEGLKYLVNFMPAETLLDLKAADQKLLKGIESDGFLYRLGFYALAEHTFALRSIAFQRNVVGPLSNPKFDEFQIDKRDDVIVVFKVVEVDFAGNVTIVWHELARRDAPKIKIEREN
jgi:hypothetical protein